MIMTDDCWAANATYFDGKHDENTPNRRRHAEQVWLEYMPVDLDETQSGEIPITDSQLFPNNQIYRDFRFGQHLHLILTDYRSYRPNHLIPEDAYPGTVVLDSTALRTLLTAQGFDQLKNRFAPYFNIDDAQYARYKQVLMATTTQAYIAEGLEAETAAVKANHVIQGNLDVTVINNTLRTYNASVSAEQQVPLFSDAQIAVMERGLSYLYLGKQNLFSNLGSRYSVIKKSYDLLAASQYFATGGLSKQALGTEQEAWLTATVTNSDATWRVIGNSVSLTSLQTDLSGESPLPAELESVVDSIPTAFHNRFYLNLDHWDGFPNKRQELVGLLDSIPNTLLIAGDIHANFVAQHGKQTYEFTGTAISSSTFGSIFEEQMVAIGIPTATVQALDALLQLANPSIRYAKSNHNGVAIMRLDGQAANVTYYELTPEDVAVSYYDNRETLNNKFIIHQFTVQDGVLQIVS
jgi:alkaline phosphatase D